MLKRTLILALWFYAGWTLGGLLTWSTDLPEIIGPVIGAAAALAIAADPRRWFSNRPAARPEQGSTGVSPESS